MQFNNIRFIGHLSLNDSDSNGEFRKEFLDKFKVFMKAKDDVVLFSVNEYNYDDEKQQCSIKGECLSYLESKIDERLLNSYIHEFRIQFGYDLNMYRLYNDKEGTELFPVENKKVIENNKEENESENKNEEKASQNDLEVNNAQQQNDNKKEPEEVKQKKAENIESVKKADEPVKAEEYIEVEEHIKAEEKALQEDDAVKENSVSNIDENQQEDGEEIKVTAKPVEKIVRAHETPKAPSVPRPKEIGAASAKSEPYLYHYTTIENLALILKNKNIKFNNLANMRKLDYNLDEEESLYDRLCFISSWTKERNESISLWNMYTNMKGVRLRLPADPFKMYLYDGGSVKMKSNININEYFKNIKNYQMASLKTIQAVDILYIKGASKMFPRINVMDKVNFIDYSNKLGLYKEDIHAQEKESVYRMFIYPWMLEESKKVMSNSDEIKNRFDNSILPFNEKFLDIDEVKFKDMEIVLGPGCGEGEKIIVELLISQYNPSAILRESALKR